MKTELITLEEYIKTGSLGSEDLGKLRHAARILREGGLVAFPTETVYGLGGNALLEDAAEKIYAAKGRPSDNPLIVHICELEDVYGIASEVPESARQLGERFWPGPMTLVLKRKSIIPAKTCGGLDTVAVRLPSHPAARELIRLSGVPVAAPSANLSGRPSTTSAKHCIDDLGGRVDAVIDAGSSEIGLESTIIDLTGAGPVILRPGAVTAEMIAAATGVMPVNDKAVTGPLGENDIPKAPGMKYRHYAPKAPMTLVTARDFSDEQRAVRAVAARIAEMLDDNRKNGIKTTLICSHECRRFIGEISKSAADGADVHIIGHAGRKEQYARMLFDTLRSADASGAQSVIAEGCSETELGAAVMNRLKKAAGWSITEV